MLRGSRILIVEDDGLVALELAMLLTEEEASVVGPYSDLDQTLSNMDQVISCALLDIDLNGTPVFAVADRLVERGVPFAFLTGGDINLMPEPYRYAPLIRKPFGESEVVAMVAALIQIDVDADVRRAQFQRRAHAQLG